MTNSLPLQYPERFVNQVRDWIETLIRFARSRSAPPSRSAGELLLPTEKCILSFLDFGLITSSVSSLLKASQHLLQFRNEFGMSDCLPEASGFTSSVQRLFAVATSEPQCFHNLSHFPMSIPDRKKCKLPSFRREHSILALLFVSFLKMKGLVETDACIFGV